MHVTLTLLMGVVAAMASLLGAWAPQTEAVSAPPPLGPGGQIVLIIVDGLRPDMISAEVSPTLQRLVDEGAASLDAVSVRPSLTLPAITSMLTGLRPQDHGITFNDYQPQGNVVEATTVFDVVREAGLATAFFSGKVKLRHAASPEAVDTYSVRFLPDVSVITLGRAFLLENRPGLLVVHLPNMDRAGHEFGWSSDRQTQTLRATDVAITSLIAAIESDAVTGPARVIVTADHGGSGRNHYRDLSGNRTVPWIIWGDGIVAAELPRISITTTAATIIESLGLAAPRQMAPGLGR